MGKRGGGVRGTLLQQDRLARSARWKFEQAEKSEKQATSPGLESSES